MPQTSREFVPRAAEMDASVDEQQGGASTTKERRRAGPTKSVAAAGNFAGVASAGGEGMGEGEERREREIDVSADLVPPALGVPSVPAPSSDSPGF